MLPSAPACVIHIPAALSAMPRQASSTTVRTWTGSGCIRRWYPSMAMPAAMAKRTAPFTSAARISSRR